MKIIENSATIEREIADVVESKQAHRIGLEVIDSVEGFKLNDENKYLIEDILHTYYEYLSKLSLLDEYYTPFLHTLRNIAVINNQTIESVSPFLAEMYLNSHKMSGTLYSHENKLNKEICSYEDFLKIHAYLMDGIISEDNLTGGTRTNNTSFVGRHENGQRIIDYIPVESSLIPEVLNYILNMYNTRVVTDESDILVKPFLTQSLIAAYQCFNDGNTRLARIIGSTQIWDLTVHNSAYKYLGSPAVYPSEAIQLEKKGVFFRELILDMTLHPNDETINRWINENLLIFEKQIFLNQRKFEDAATALQRIRKG